jgi:AraC family transcriptional regulator, regulatory protein of adaptative response / DNA-3-methyladenine glycosylase II
MTPDAQDAAWHHAVNTRDASFDGVFFVAITSTHIYCRPICPSRLARPENRRFFVSRDDAEAAGFRACKRCRPELTAGASSVDAVPRLAQQALVQITNGALDHTTVQALASALGMSDRHLRRAVTRELGASPFSLALAQRLRAATDLLADSRHTISHIAYASGFQSLRRFNAAFRQHFQMSPTEWRQREMRG